MVDVCLVVEGTYPYIRGGVSSWVHQLITNLPNTNFGIIHIAARADAAREFRYDVPANVTVLEDVYLHEYHYMEKPKYKKYKQSWKDVYLQFHQEVSQNQYHSLETIVNTFHSHKSFLSFEEMTFSPESWSMVEKFYQESDPNQSFIDFFWTWRYTHMPIFKILNQKLPEAKVYHTVSTGFAGVCAVIAKMKYKAALLLTEHGIYTRERKLEIEDAQWIYQAQTAIDKQEKKDFFKKIWIRFFQFTGRITYEYADLIVTLCESNRAIELSEGADRRKTQIIPNGIFTERYQDLRKKFNERPKTKPYIIGFVGRVVSIKDVKTLIRALKIVYDRVPDISLLVIGPTDEELDYYQECLDLIKVLDIESIITFTGQANLDDYYYKLDLMVLTSISEGQPLVILEASCVGIPVIATDVGSCRELLYGITTEDQQIGKSGLITDVASPQGTAEAIITLLEDDDLRHRYGENGKLRVDRYYQQQDLLAAYNTLYENLKYRNQ